MHAYLDSRPTRRMPRKWFAQRHLAGGLANTALTKDDCNAEYFRISGGARDDVPEMEDAPGVRLFLRATRDIDDGEEVLVWYGRQYVRELL